MKSPKSPNLYNRNARISAYMSGTFLGMALLAGGGALICHQQLKTDDGSINHLGNQAAPFDIALTYQTYNDDTRDEGLFELAGEAGVAAALAMASLTHYYHLKADSATTNTVVPPTPEQAVAI